MRAFVGLTQVFRQVIREPSRLPQCMKCGKPATIADCQENPAKIRVTLLCHEAVEVVELIPDEAGFDVSPNRAIKNLMAQWPAQVFLQRWAAYKTTTRPERRVVR